MILRRAGCCLEECYACRNFCGVHYVRCRRDTSGRRGRATPTLLCNDFLISNIRLDVKAEDDDVRVPNPNIGVLNRYKGDVESVNHLGEAHANI